jgi:murein DD-endopeptidase MepM/ murein hydrolase activator NlpD
MDQNGMRAATTKVPGFLARAFPEATVTIRCSAASRCLRLSPRAQALAVAAAGAFGLWTAGSTGILALHSYAHLEHVRAIEAAGATYRDRLAALEAERDALAARAAAAETTATAHGGGSMSGQVAAGAVTLAAAAAERDALRAELEAARSALAATEARLARAEAERRDLGDSLARIAGALDDAATDRDAARAEATEAETARDAMAADAAEMQGLQDRVLAQIEAVAARSIGPLESALRDAGVDVERVLDALRRDGDGQGGPLLPPAEPEPAAGPRVVSIVSDLERVALLRAATDRMPFALPVRGARMTSGFGNRRDPLVRRLARHEGIDFAARVGHPIEAPAEGVVSFVGAQRGYGRMIKIRHAFGMETVYAHLSRSRVAVGDRVRRGQRIADVGNTGRSTGPHLHYEVHVDGRPVDPMKFIEAGRHVL